MSRRQINTLLRVFEAQKNCEDTIKEIDISKIDSNENYFHVKIKKKLQQVLNELTSKKALATTHEIN